jgi:hypothetical protein
VSNDPLHDMALAAADLKATNSQRFDDMVDQLFKYEVKSIDELLAAGPDDVFGAQAKAKTIRQLRLKLQTCMLIREQAEKRR